MQSFGQTGDDPKVIGDYDGDGRTDFAVYRAGSLVRGAEHLVLAAQLRRSAGRARLGPARRRARRPATTTAITSRTSACGATRAARRRCSILQESTAGFRTVTFGFPDDIVVPGDYDGDGKTDLAVTRKSGGQLKWFALRSSDSAVQGMSWGMTPI